jgi:hypothetical protein
LTISASLPTNGSSVDQIGNKVLLVDQIGLPPGQFETRTSLNVVMVGHCRHEIYNGSCRLQTLHKRLFLNESNVLYRTPNSNLT